nr:hypothetical protein Iba_chr05fCG7750 [Ipomoea batatas]
MKNDASKQTRPKASHPTQVPCQTSSYEPSQNANMQAQADSLHLTPAGSSHHTQNATIKQSKKNSVVNCSADSILHTTPQQLIGSQSGAKVRYQAKATMIPLAFSIAVLSVSHLNPSTQATGVFSGRLVPSTPTGRSLGTTNGHIFLFHVGCALWFIGFPLWRIMFPFSPELKHPEDFTDSFWWLSGSYFLLASYFRLAVGPRSSVFTLLTSDSFFETTNYGDKSDETETMGSEGERCEITVEANGKDINEGQDPREKYLDN